MTDDRLKAALSEVLLGSFRTSVLVLSRSGSLLYANHSFELLLGYSSQEIKIASAQDLFPTLPLDRWFGPVHERESGVSAAVRDVPATRKDGSIVYTDVELLQTSLDEQPALVLKLREVSDRRRTERELRREVALTKAIVDAAIDGIITIDEQGTVRTVNPAIEKIFGYQPQELVGKNVRMLMPPPYHEEHDHYLENYRRTGHRKIIGIGREVEGKRQDGTVFPLDLAVSETHTEEGVIFTGIIRDISERVEAVEMQIARDAAMQANSAKSEFLSRMSHELRTPLNAVIGFAQVLEMRFEDPKILDPVKSILKAGQHLLGLINEVLDLSRIEAGRLTISIKPVRLVPILLQAVEIVRPIAEKANIEVDADTHLANESYVMADRQRLLQVLINLLSNAVKYNRAGGRVLATCEAYGDEFVRVMIEDTGFGITPEQRQRLFQPFERLGNQTAEGTGLGLVLSRRFVELMNGELSLFESSPAGSKFSVSLKKANRSEPATASPARSAGAVAAHVSGSILYVEDNLSNMKLVEMVLETWPAITLIPALQGQVGLDLANTHDLDVIFLDLHLPDLSGEEVLRMLKANPKTAQIPVVIISADATPGQIRRLRSAGAYDYLTKPLDVQRFLMIVQFLLVEDLS